MISSSKPSKQRIYRKHAPMHARRKMMNSHLSKELKTKFKKRAMIVRKGDEVIIMRGAFKGTKGKVERVVRKDLKIYLDNVFFEKKNGSKTKIPIDPSKVMITSLDTSDAKRFGEEKK